MSCWRVHSTWNMGFSLPTYITCYDLFPTRHCSSRSNSLLTVYFYWIETIAGETNISPFYYSVCLLHSIVSFLHKSLTSYRFFCSLCKQFWTIRWGSTNPGRADLVIAFAIFVLCFLLLLIVSLNQRRLLQDNKREVNNAYESSKQTSHTKKFGMS